MSFYDDIKTKVFKIVENTSPYTSERAYKTEQFVNDLFKPLIGDSYFQDIQDIKHDIKVQNDYKYIDLIVEDILTQYALFLKETCGGKNNGN